MTDQRRVVITGVGRGLGLAMTEEFVRLGHVVLGCARSEAAIDRLRSRFSEPHHFSVVDISDDAQVAAWASEVLNGSDPPDLLINNAALINENANLWEVPLEQYSRIIDVNVKGPYHVIRHFLPAMIRNGSGVVVNFSSTWGRSTSPQVASFRDASLAHSL